MNNIVAGSIVILVSFIWTGVYFYFKNIYSFWQKKGLNGPKPLLLIGNFHQIIFSNRLELELKWFKEFGKIYGFYRGKSAQLVVCDLELIHQITIKDFDSFTDHESLDYFNKYQKSFIFFSKGDHWKKVRALMSPTFTSGKIKRMFKFLDHCADDLVDSFKEQLKTDHYSENKTLTPAIVNVMDLYYLYTMDAITTCCYGLKMERDHKVKDIKSAASRNDFVKFITKVFSFSIPRFVIGAIIPSSLLKWFNFHLVKEENFTPLADYLQQLIEKRRKMPEKKFDDYLQILIDARLDDKMDLNETDSKENHHANLTYDSLLNDQKKMIEYIKSRQPSRTDEITLDNNSKATTTTDNNNNNNNNSNISLLSDLEIISGGMFLLFVGLDTTAVLLSQCTYALAFHRKEQQKLYNELSKIVREQNSFDYEELTSCQYLDSVIAETLRLLPPFPVTNRVATRDYYIEKYKLKIAKGTVVHLNNYVLMNSSEYWHEPLKFNPERFMPGEKEKIKPGTYCPFGVGPRHCIGMRFSLTEAKLAMAKLVMKFEFHPVDGCKFPADTALSPFMVKPKKPLVKLTLREH